MTAIVDPGLQPERTALAWRRTCLTLLVLSCASLRVLPERIGTAGVVGSVILVTLSVSLLAVVHRRYRRQDRETGGAVLAGVAVLASVLAALAAAAVFAWPQA